MNMPFADVCDRFTIVSLKLTNLSQSGDLTSPEESNLQQQEEELLAEINYIKSRLPAKKLKELDTLLFSLVAWNASIWQEEADLRAGVEMGLEEVGNRAIRIRKFNKERVSVKNEISKLVGESHWVDVKINHVSETSK